MSSKKRIDHDGARIYELLNPKPKELLQKRRTLVKSGDVIMWSNNEKILKKRYLFLFEDVLLITKKEFTQNYWLKIFITLKPEIKADLFKASKYKIPNVEFRIHCQNATFALFGKSREEAETWVRDINKGCGHNQRRNNDEDEPRRETPKKREEYSDVQKYNKTGESKKETKQLNIDENLIPNQFFDTGNSFNDTPPTYHESIQSQQKIISQPTSQPNYSNDLNNLFSLPQQNNNQQQINNNNIPQQQQNIPQQQFQFTGNTNMFGNFPPQQQPQQQPQQNFPPQQQNTLPQQQDTNLFNPFLQQQQFVQPQQQQTFSVVAFEQNGLKIVFDFPPKENGIILLNMRSTNANNIPITNFSIKMAAPSYVDLKMAVASGEVLQVNNSNTVEQRVKLLNTLQGIKPLILKIKIDGQFGNELISLVHTVSTLPENI